MVARKRKRGQSSAKQVINGLVLDRPSDFFKKICNVLQKSLGLPFATTQIMQLGTQELHYVRETNPIHVFVTEKPLPALPLHIGGAQSAWLVVEVECESGKPTILQQVSLKVHQGPTTDATTICFRAEWDMRDPDSDHAQPHWNVHAPTAETHAASEALAQDSFADLIQRQKLDTFASFADEQDRLGTEIVPSSENLLQHSVIISGFTSEQMHRFHFAMAVDWHNRSGLHSPQLTNPDQMVQWIAECAKYMKGQFSFMMLHQ